MIEKNKVIDALYVIKQICSECDICTKCTFYDSSDGCRIKIIDPSDWKINCDDIWKALL